jgi:DNA ligase 4
MPLAFSIYSSLLSRLEAIEIREPTILVPARKASELQAATESWFKSHRNKLDVLETKEAVALLSCLLPERRTDRVYCMQAATLCRILARGLSLGASRAKDLQAYKEPGQGDLGQCVQMVLRAGGPCATPAVTLEEVDDMLLELASHSRFSSPATTAATPRSSSKSKDQLIGDIFKRLSPEEGKWLVRLILKDFSPVTINETLLLKSFHFLLPDLLRFQNDFAAAIRLLKNRTFRDYPAQPDRRSIPLHRRAAASELKPVVGVKVGRPEFKKARGVDQCFKWVGAEKWVLERKYDGEYCEVHVDLQRSANPLKCIQTFSKSGKDSTADLKALHGTLVKSFGMGTPDCKFKRQAIFLGELVVYSDSERCVLPFDKIRKHVPRSGIFIGTDQDSQPHAHEHLAIAFFDLLLLDDEIVMNRPVEERRNWLREAYTKIAGRAFGVEWKVVDFAEQAKSKRLLVQQFAASIAQRCEGLILKPCGVPYFSLEKGGTFYIKLKKDYIIGMGDEADFAIIGASYNAQQASKSGLANIKWTDFHLGCIINATEVQRSDARPMFKYVGTIQQDQCIPNPILQTLNRLGAYHAKPYDGSVPPANFDIRADTRLRMCTVFDVPFVVEVLGGGFDKPSNCAFFMLRHPRITKLHQDRSWKETISFQPLQEQAHAARQLPETTESQETKDWVARFEERLKGRLDREGTLTPKSKSSRRTPSTVVTSTARSTKAAQPKALVGCKRQRTSNEDLEGTTLINAGPKKAAPRVQSITSLTPCPPVKRGRTEVSNPHTSSRSSRPPSGTTPSLADITNKVTERVRNWIEAHQNQPPSDLPQPSKPPSLPPPRPKRSLPSSALPSPPSSQNCDPTRCLFANATIYLSPCLTTSAYITKDLLSIHNGTLQTKDISHWDRDSFAHPPLTATVGESQAYGSMRKLILVEHKRPQAVKDVLRRLVILNDGSFRERVEVYDWRVLEQCKEHERAAGELKRYFIGATMFDEGRERTMFVSRYSGFAIGG